MPKTVALLQQIEQITSQLHMIQGEVSSMTKASAMPDASMQLGDVIRHSEESTMNILNAAVEIGGYVTELETARREPIEALVGTILEACSFQDISGQRIKKVIGFLADLEKRLEALAAIARGEAVALPEAPPASGDAALMNGPQLTAPDQAAIDSLFNS